MKEGAWDGAVTSTYYLDGDGMEIEMHCNEVYNAAGMWLTREDEPKVFDFDIADRTF